MIKSIKHIAIILVAIIAINYVSSKVYKRFDLTSDNRYTLSEAALKTIKNVDAPIIVDVFLEGVFPSEFKRLQSETKQILEEFSAYNDQVNFKFINPIEDDESRERNIQQLSDRGLTPLQLSVQESGKSSQEITRKKKELDTLMHPSPSLCKPRSN